MAEQTNAYEAMFLASQRVASDFGGLIDHINELLGRAGVEVIAMQKWDERRLAYEIEKQRRGVYILSYFRADPQKIQQLERDCNLSERIMRLLVLRADHLTQDEMAAFDQRQALADEAKMRAERAAEQDEVTSKVQVRTAEEQAEAASREAEEARQSEQAEGGEGGESGEPEEAAARAD